MYSFGNPHLNSSARMFSAMKIHPHFAWVHAHARLDWSEAELGQLTKAGDTILRESKNRIWVFRRVPSDTEMTDVINYLLLSELLMIEVFQRNTSLWNQAFQLHSRLCEPIGRYRERHLPRPELLMQAIEHAVIGLRQILGQ